MPAPGLPPEEVLYEPADEDVGKLADFLYSLSKQWPFTHLFTAGRKVIPMLGIAGPSYKSGGSLQGDLLQYALGWHKANPGKASAILAYEVMQGNIRLPVNPLVRQETVPYDSTADAPPPDGPDEWPPTPAPGRTDERAPAAAFDPARYAAGGL